MSDNVGLESFFDAVRRRPLIETAEYEVELANRIAEGDKRAKEELIERNIRLAISIARRYQGRGVELEDLIQEGVIGLNRAAEKFDPAKGFKFSTYATWWVRHFVARAVSKQRDTIRRPGAVMQLKQMIDRHRDEFPSASIAELATICEATEDQVINALDGAHVTSSLNGTINETERMDMIEDESADDPLEMAITSVERHRLARALAVLNERELEVVKLRFGFTTGNVHSRDKTAEILGITARHVKDAQRSALEKLRGELTREADTVDLVDPEE